MMDTENQLPGEQRNLNSPDQQALSHDDIDQLLNPSRELSMEEYATLVRDIPFPTASQRENFVEHTTTAHSWYKHLPLYLPGAPFLLFFDRFAGCDCRCGFFVEKKERGEHYSDLTTAEHRARFGFLSYCFSDKTIELLDHRDTVPWDELSAQLGTFTQLSAMPQQLLDAGRVELTAVIHRLSHHYHHWDDPGWWARSDVYWPTESGGETTLNRILERCAEMRRPEYQLEENRKKRREAMESLILREEMKPGDRYNLSIADPILHELLEPERMRQKKEMLNAIDQICTLIHDARSTGGTVTAT